jgi:hypothetical protein
MGPWENYETTNSEADAPWLKYSSPKQNEQDVGSKLLNAAGRGISNIPNQLMSLGESAYKFASEPSKAPERLANVSKGIPQGLGNALIGGTQFAANLGEQAAKVIEKQVYGDNLADNKTNFTKQLNQNVKQLLEQQSKLPKSEQIGIGIGESTPYLAMGGAKAPIAGAIAGGGLSSFLAPQKEDSLMNRAENAVESATGAGSLVGGVKAVKAVANAPKTLVQKVAGITPKSQETLKAFQDAGINPTLANIAEGQTSKTFQNLLESFPGSRGVIEKATQEQVDNITKQIAKISKSEGGTIQETGKKIQEGTQNVKQALESRIDKNYNDLDQFVLTESQKATKPKLLDAIDEWEKLKLIEQDLMVSVKGNAKAGSFIGSSPAHTKEYSSLKNLEEDLTASVKGNSVVAGVINEDAARKLGFWKNRARQNSSEFINEAAEDARSLQNVKKQITKEAKNSKPANSDFISKAADEARSLANIRKQIANQEKIISSHEKYMSPDQFQSALMSGQKKIPTNNLGSLVKDSHIQDVVAVGSGDTARVVSRYSQIVDDAGNVSYPRLKTFRSTIGRKLESPFLMGDERSALKKIYSALSQDMKEAVVENGGERGLQAFNKANNAFGRYQNILESKINPLIEAKTPEAVYAMATSGTKQGGSNIRGIMKTLAPEQKEFVQGTITKRMGLANAGEQDATGEVFSPNKFLTEWSKLSPEAKANIYDKNQVLAINNLNKAIDTIKATSKAKQSSNNLPYAAWIGLGSLSLANLPAGVAAVAGANITARMMTNPSFINWLSKAPKVSQRNIPKHLKTLSIIASRNPDIREDVLDYLGSITQEQNNN